MSNMGEECRKLSRTGEPSEDYSMMLDKTLYWHWLGIHKKYIMNNQFTQDNVLNSDVLVHLRHALNLNLI
jgi:hypothetical protein